VLVMSPPLAREAATRALEMQKREVTTHQRLRAGEKLPDITGATAIVEAKLVKR
jgi:4-hydroxy-4-methyl-2-oxoglutarate aldolase